MDFSKKREKPIFAGKKNATQPDDLKKRLASLYLYLSKHLQIREPPKVTFTKDKENAKNPFGFTGYYDHDTKSIRLYITDRHNTDILRSFAHEVIHHWQNENGTLHPEGEAKNQPHEHYAQNNPNLRKREMEAYLFGNILFRDWQDEQRYGPPKVAPLMPSPINESHSHIVECQNCHKKFDYSNVPEVAMGAVQCPNCNVTLNQEGTVLRYDSKTCS